MTSWYPPPGRAVHIDSGRPASFGLSSVPSTQLDLAPHRQIAIPPAAQGEVADLRGHSGFMVVVRAFMKAPHCAQSSHPRRSD